MKYYKKILAFILALIMVLMSFSGCVGSLDSNKDGEYITKGQWITILSKYFGFDQCQSDAPYFTDVGKDNAVFTCLQSCYEWGIVSNSEPFEADKTADKEFIASTAVLAIGNEYTGLDIASPLKDKIKYAVENKIITSKAFLYLKTGISAENAENIAQQSVVVYNSQELKEYDNTVINSNVKDLRKDSEIAFLPDNSTVDTNTENSDNENIIDSLSLSGYANGTVTMTGDKTSDYKIGDVILIPGDILNPGGISRKITNISFNGTNTVFETIAPEIGEVYEELDFAQTATVTDANQIIPEPGVSISGFSTSEMATESVNDVKASFLDKKQDDLSLENMKKGTSFTINVSKDSNGKISLSASNPNNGVSAEVSGSPILYDSKGKVYDPSELYNKTGKGKLLVNDKKIKVDASDKYTGGWKLSGSISVKDLYLDSSFKAKKAFNIPVGIDTCQIKSHCKFESSLSIEGELKEKICIATVPIPIGPTSLSVKLKLYAEAGINGEISITYSTETTSNIEYSSEKGFKKTQQTTNSNSLSLAGDLTVGVGFNCVLSAAAIDLCDVGIDVGMGLHFEFKATQLLRTETGIYALGGDEASLDHYDNAVLFCADAEVYFPTLSVAFNMESSTLAYKLGIKFKWKAIDRSGASFKSTSIGQHYEVGNGFVSKCSADSFKPYISDEEISSALSDENATTSKNTNFMISAYVLTLSKGASDKLSVTGLPNGYTAGDVIFVCDDNSIATVDITSNISENIASCTVKGVKSGSTSITIQTKDKKYSLNCAVLVGE